MENKEKAQKDDMIEDEEEEEEEEEQISQEQLDAMLLQACKDNNYEEA